MKCLWAALFAGVSAVMAEDFLRESFDAPHLWQELQISESSNRTTFTLVKDRTNRYLEAVGRRSVSGLVFSNAFDIKRFSLAEWQWRLDSAPPVTGEPPLRVRFTFEYDGQPASLLDRVAAVMHGRPPPHSILEYVWAGTASVGTVQGSPENPRARRVVVSNASHPTGAWTSVRADVSADYLRVFSSEPPRTARISLVCGDESSDAEVRAYFDNIAVFSP